MSRIVRLISFALLIGSISSWAQESMEADTPYTDILLLRPIDIFGQKHLADDKKTKNVIRIERREIEALPVQTINELLEYSMSLDVRQKGVFDVQADLSLRGSTFDQVLVMLNGHPLNDPQTGHHNLNLPIGLEEVEAVEILYGGASVRYGPYAFAGTVNFITKYSFNAADVNAEAQGGSFGYRMFRAGTSIKGERNAMNINLQHSASDGYISNTDFEQYNIHLQSDHFTRKIGMNHIRLEAGFNSKDFGAQSFYSTRYPLQFEATRTAFVAAQLKSPINSYIHYAARIFARRHWDRFELFRETGGPYSFSNGYFINGNDTVPSWYQGHNYHRTDVLGGDALASFDDCIGRVEAGMDFRYEGIYSNALGEPLDKAVDVAGSDRAQYTRASNRRNIGLFAIHKFELPYDLMLELGLRYNHNTAFGDDWLPSAKIQVPWESEEYNWQLHLSWNRAFRLPTYTDLYYNLGGAIGSINLKPEYSSNYEVGLELSVKNPFLSSTSSSNESIYFGLFRREGQNLIDWIILPNDPTQSLRASNISSLNINGIELNYRAWNVNAKGKKFTWLRYGLEATYMFADDRPNNFESLYTLDYLQFKSGVFAQWNLDWDLRYSLRLSHQDRLGEYQDALTGDLRAFDDVILLDSRLEWKGLKNWKAYLDVNNILGEEYADIANVVLPGASMRIGLQYRL